MDLEMENTKNQTLDLSKKCLKKVPKQDDAQNIKVLILDENELQKIDNIDSYLRIEKLSLCKNQLLRMYGVCRLHCLQELHLAYNGILTIEGLKELTQLTHLNLEGNNIKAIEHLNTNIKLEYLNLAENSIGNISDISYLKSLKELYLNGNRITHLRQCEKYLPSSLETLTLSKNGLTDLNEICSLTNLSNLRSISIADNPCVQVTGSPYRTVAFDYRPFVLNWCMSVKLIDGFVVNAIESLKAEWLYSQGRGRQFRIGEQVDLANYLSSTCPLSGEILENENERKLRLILSKAQQHQRQLQEEISGMSSKRILWTQQLTLSPQTEKMKNSKSYLLAIEKSNKFSKMENTNTSGGNSPSSARRKGQGSSRIQSPRFSRLGRQGSPDSSMSSSYHGNTSSCSLLSQQNDGNNLIHMTTSLIANIKSDQNIMVQSLDPNILSGGGNNKNSSLHDLTVRQNNMMMSSNQFNEQISQNRQGCPLAAASKMVPVPESLMSPDCPPPNVVQQQQQRSSIIQNQTKSNKTKESKVTNSPKVSRHSALSKRAEKSPILNNSRKQNQSARANNCSSELSIKQKALNSIVNQVVQITPPDDLNNNSSDDDSDHINVDKLKTIRNKAAQRSQQKENIDISSSMNINKQTERSAILIQKIWRGYQTRQRVKDVAVKLQKKRTQEYIEKLTHDMETTKVALENERKIQQLQMQAINALWKKVSTMQTGTTNTVTSSSHNEANNQMILNENHSTVIVQDLAKTCSVLTNQVQQLQGSMRDILQCMTVFCNLPQQQQQQQTTATSTDVRDNCGTQTEIIAVHTPQVDNPPFPFNNKLMRPSTLPLDSNETSPSLPNDLSNEVDNLLEKPCKDDCTVSPIDKDNLNEKDSISSSDSNLKSDNYTNIIVSAGGIASGDSNKDD